MSITVKTPARKEAKAVPMDSLRKTAVVAGGLYVLTFASSIPALFLIAPALDDPDYIVGSGAATGVIFGNFLDVINALACIGTAVALFPVIKRQSEAAALGFVTSRVLEAAIIFIGVVSLLSIVTLRQDLAGAAGADVASLVTTGQALVAIHDWTVLFGPNLLAGVNGLLLGYLMYRSGLVPRIIPLLGLIGGPLLIASTIAVLFGFHSRVSPSFLITVPPIFIWELSLGVWLVVKGFKPSPVTAGLTAATSPPAYRDVAV